MSKPTIFIAMAGQIGTATLAHLDKKKFNIKVGVHSPEKAEKLKEQGYETVVMDFDKKKRVFEQHLKELTDSLLLLQEPKQEEDKQLEQFDKLSK